MESSVNHGLLRIARQRKGLSQGEAAKRLSMQQATLSRYENAASVPPEDFLARAALVYELPQSFFYQTDTVLGGPVSVHPMWRKKHSVTVRELDEIIAELNIRIFHIRRLLEAVEFAPQISIPKLDIDEYDEDEVNEYDEEIERIAATVRAHWLIPSGPFHDLTGIIERAGAIIIHSQLGGSSVSGVTMSVPGLLPVIILNNEQPSDRARFTLAHELAHLVMHRFPNKDMEKQANAFASALLMPAKDIRDAFSGRIDLKRLAALKPEWKVSMQALLYRAQSLGLIDRVPASYLWRQFNIHRMKMREPAELDFPWERAGVMQRMIRLHLDNFGYSLPDFAQILHLHTHQLDQFYEIGMTPENPAGGVRLRMVP